REPDGLAMSSRNKRLSPEERAMAPVIYRILRKAKNLREQMTVQQLTDWAREEFSKHPAFALEYFEIVDADTLQPVESWENNDRIIACTAARLGNVRLIDNIKFF
ncbi:MAG TPA: pantoate--beta-alanine ligase, partial [Bacteroidales bacterium]|nr:pantoate--beta-alanine ligase [Bacteroidales bacterium]